jgi:hypothetical protein
MNSDITMKCPHCSMALSGIIGTVGTDYTHAAHNGVINVARFACSVRNGRCYRVLTLMYQAQGLSNVTHICDKQHKL